MKSASTVAPSCSSSTSVWVTQESVLQASALKNQKKNEASKLKGMKLTHLTSNDNETNGWHWIMASLIHTSSSNTELMNNNNSKMILQTISPNRTRPKSSSSSMGQHQHSVSMSTIQITDPSSPYNGSILQVPNADVCRRTVSDLYYDKKRFVQVDQQKNREEGIDEEEPMSDISQLPHLNTPSIVDLLEHRYNYTSGKNNDEKPLIYTSTGGNAILIAVNPYCNLPGYYSELKVKEYQAQLFNGKSTKGGEPHVFHTSMCAYHDMCEAMEKHSSSNDLSNDDYRTKIDQCILVSGESGAGKTVTTGYALQFLCHVSSNGDNNNIQNQVLSSNPLLESFGNAHTRRNSNSSRFGKFLTLHFDKGHKLSGADIKTYLLERKRVLGGYTSAERGFHVFHELLNGAPKSLKDIIQLSGNETKYRITASGSNVSDAATDKENWKQLVEAMALLDVPLQPVCEILSSLLHLSNLNFTNIDHDEINKISNLLNISSEELQRILTTMKISTPTDEVVIPLTSQQSELQRDAVIMTIYQGLFTYLVSCINSKLSFDDDLSKSRISILDIFGFEWYDNNSSNTVSNSLEQLCINYCNEALQRQFSNFALHLEYQEYAEEGLITSLLPTSSNDSNEVISCLERSVFNIVNDMSLSLRGNDNMTHMDAITRQIRYEKPILTATPTQQANGRFQIQHYAGNVVYDTSEFLTKNNDVPLTSVLAGLLDTSKSMFIRNLSQQIQPKQELSSRRIGSAKNQSKTTLQIFTKQLSSLMRTINKTQPHYIRCIKPNSNARKLEFDRDLVVKQLRCNGVLEAVRVARLGFPHRMGGADFLQRYSICIEGLHHRPSQCPLFDNSFPPNLDQVQHLVERLSIKQDIQLGKKTKINSGKVFLTQLAYERLEVKRMIVLVEYATVIESNVRCWLARKEVAARRLLKRQKEEEEKIRLMQVEQQRIAQEQKERLAVQNQLVSRLSPPTIGVDSTPVRYHVKKLAARKQRDVKRAPPIPRKDLIRRIHALCHNDLKGTRNKWERELELSKKFKWKLVGANWTRVDMK